jgi:hypothetical protein
MRAPARGWERDPHPVWPGLVAGAAPLPACSASVLWDGHGRQLPLAALDAVRRGVQDGMISAEPAIQRLARSRPGVGTARAAASQLRWASAVGPRPLALAPRVGPPGAQRWAPDDGPWCVSDGDRDSRLAVWAPVGGWGQPEPRQGQGPQPPPRGLPRPQWL